MNDTYAKMATEICLNIDIMARTGSLTYEKLFSRLISLERVLDLIRIPRSNSERVRIALVLRQTDEAITRIGPSFSHKPLITKDITSILKICNSLISELEKGILEEQTIKKSQINEMKTLICQNIQAVSSLQRIVETREMTRVKFVESSPIVRSLRDTITAMIHNTKEEGTIYITGYFDNCLLTELKIAMDEKKVRVRIIHPTIRDSRGEDRRNLDALKRLIEKRIGEVKYSDLVHARIFMTDEEVVVSSADMKNNSLGGAHFEAGIYSNDPIMIDSIKDFFERIWNESTILER